MKTFAEIKHDVAYFGSTGIGILHTGRIAVLHGEACPERRSVGVIAIGQCGKPVMVRVPLESISVLGGYTPEEQSPDRLYVGEYSGGDYRVTVFRLDGSGDAVGEPYALHNPHRHGCGLGWGYDGDGPADLALALLLDATTALGTDEAARRALVEAHYMTFRRDFVERQPERDRWSTTGSDLLKRLNTIVKDAAAIA